MAIDLTINGKAYFGASGYSVAEDSTPIDPSDTSGGVGQFTVTIPEKDGAKAFRGATVALQDGSQGTTTGTANSLSGNGSNVTITSDSRLAALMAIRTAHPYSGTLEGAVGYYLGLVGLTSGIVIDSTVASLPAVLPGWSGRVWDFLAKKLCPALGVEISLVSNNVVVRPVRGRIAQNYRDSSVTWALDATNLAQSVEVYYYQSEARTDSLAYPIGGWNTETPIQQGIDAGQTQTFTLSLIPRDVGPGASIASVQQPVCVDWVDSWHDSSSVYSVVGRDGLVVPPAQWAAGGGSLSVAIGEDTRSLIVTITGSSETEYAPYKIAMPSGTSDEYSSLRIVGSGVFFDRQLLTLTTGLSVDEAPAEIGATVDNEAINTYSDAFAAGLWTLAAFSAARQTINVTTTGINRRGDTGSYRYSTMADANLEYAGLKMGDVNALWPGATMGEVSAWWKEKTQSDFANQAFGNVAGSRVLNDGQWYRIRSVPSLNPATIQYSAERDLVSADLNKRYAGLTMGEVNAIWTGAKFRDFNVQPVKE